MTEPSDLTPEQEAVRRLLADARHDQPTPDPVIARLDATLAGLVAERAEPQRAPVVDLAARRRRLASIGVLAAAAVVVAGVALGQVLPQSGSDDSASETSSAVDDGSAGGAADSRSGESDAGADAESSEPSKLKSPVPEAATVLPRVSLDADLGESLTDLRTFSSQSLSSADTLPRCDVGDAGRGRRILVQVDDLPGLVVFRAPQGARQEAVVFLCGYSEPVRTLSLPAP